MKKWPLREPFAVPAVLSHRPGERPECARFPHLLRSAVRPLYTGRAPPRAPYPPQHPPAPGRWWKSRLPSATSPTTAGRMPRSPNPMPPLKTRSGTYSVGIAPRAGGRLPTAPAGTQSRRTPSRLLGKDNPHRHTPPRSLRRRHLFTLEALKLISPPKMGSIRTTAFSIAGAKPNHKHAQQRRHL